jgi:hypothetical protein
MNRFLQKVMTVGTGACLVLSLLSVSALADEPAAQTTTDETAPAAETVSAPAETATPAETAETVRFFISLSGEIYDTTGNIQSRNSAWFSGAVAETSISGLAENHGYKLAGAADDVSGTDVSIRTSTDYSISAFPADDAVFAAIQNDQKAKKGFADKLSEVNGTNYDIKWYVVKKENDCWHIDGALVKKDPSYGVSYQYVSGTEGKELPAALTTEKIPVDNRMFHAGETVSLFEMAPAAGTVYQVRENGSVTGFWTLEKWVPASTTMVAGGVTFTGTWVYSANPQHTVTVQYYLDGQKNTAVSALTGYEGSAYMVDAALTSGKTFDGYTYASLDGETSGTLTGDKTVNVYFVKTPAAVVPVAPESTAVPMQPATEITDSATPLTPADAAAPVNSADSAATIGDSSTPLSDVPGAGTSSDTVNAAASESSKNISGDAVPMAQAPKTGDSLLAVLLTAAASLGGILVLTGKRRENA